MSVVQAPVSGLSDLTVPGAIGAGSPRPAPMAKSYESIDTIACVHVQGIGAVERVLAPPLCCECGPDEESLERGLAAGDDRAFALLVERETANVFRICYRVLGYRKDARAGVGASSRFPRTR